MLKANVGAVSFEGANPRHAHEWKLFESVKLPEGKILIPGVLDSTTNFVEHPELVAERIVRYAKLVGRENVIAGIGLRLLHVRAVGLTVHPTVTWAKLQAMAEGARDRHRAALVVACALRRAPNRRPTRRVSLMLLRR